MFATVMYGPGDVRYEQVEDPKILKPTDAIIKLSATCICGSDLWPYRGLQPQGGPAHMGHEYCGVVVEVGSEVRNIKPGQFVVGSFCLSDNTCPHCEFGFHSSCQQVEYMTGAQAPYARVPLADGTLVPTQEMPDADMIPHMLAASDVLGTGWLDYTLIRPAWLDNRDEFTYGTTHKGKPFMNKDATVSRKSVADLVVKLATTPGLEIRSSLGVHKA